MKSFEIPKVVPSVLCLCLLSGMEATPAHADFAFGRPTNLGPAINTAGHNTAPAISPDGLELYFSSGEGHIWVARRATANGAWDPASRLGPPVNSSYFDSPPFLSSDGLSLYFGSNRPGGLGAFDFWVATRAKIGDDWGTPVNVGSPVNSGSDELAMCLSPDGLELYSSSARPGGLGGYDLWVFKRATITDPWGPATNLGPTINAAGSDAWAFISPDGLSLYFESDRPGGCGGFDIWVSKRRTTTDLWGPPTNPGPMVNSSSADGSALVSHDGSMFYFVSDRPGGVGGLDLWQASIVPVVDFNGDGKVDGKEVLALARHWGQSNHVLDIGLSPMGDGTVDTNDLTVLAPYIGQDVNDPTLLAHWALDETTGMIAADSAGGNDAVVVGATWQPTGGKLGGALAFDGKDDLATRKSVLDPAAGPFSVIAWVKGGGASRVIVSQASGADWLYLNQFGMLTTDLMSSGKDGTTLTSDAYVLDDQWHRVVLTWDGANRALYMDDVEVARDTQTTLRASSGNLLIGAGKTMASTSFWSGLIDEVRIYNRAVGP